MTKPMTMNKLVRELAKKKHKRGAYKEGDREEKTWINFQIPKGLKRDFRAICEEKGYNASEIVRMFMEFTLQFKGDIREHFRKEGSKDSLS